MSLRDQFLNALEQRHLVIRGHLVIGRMARCDVGHEKKGRGDGSYVYHEGLEAQEMIAWGGYENHCDGLGWWNWHSAQEDHPPLQRSVEDCLLSLKRAEQKEIEAEKRRLSASWGAYRYWLRCGEANLTHPYLIKKDIGLYKGIRQDHDSGALVIPLCLGHEFHSVQMIDGEGGKTFWTGASIDGAYYVLGTLNTTHAYVCEGYATAWSLWEASNCPVVMACDAGNLPKVVIHLCFLYPSIQWTVCIDNDDAGRKAGEQARSSCGVMVKSWGVEGQDFNDFWQINKRGESHASWKNNIITLD